jgi:hypothetical protein
LVKSIKYRLKGGVGGRSEFKKKKKARGGGQISSQALATASCQMEAVYGSHI